jgi:hypothetical protein
MITGLEHILVCVHIAEPFELGIVYVASVILQSISGSFYAALLYWSRNPVDRTPTVFL